jgi:hypothetical protein
MELLLPSIVVEVDGSINPLYGIITAVPTANRFLIGR